MTIAPPVPRRRCSELTGTPYPLGVNEFEGERAARDHIRHEVVTTIRISFEFVR